MRIAIVSDYYYPQLGGVTEHAYGQATELARRGHDVTLITPALVSPPKAVDGAASRPEAFEVLRIGKGYPFYINASETVITVGPRLPFEIGRLFAKRQFDVLHVHNPFGVSMPIFSIARSTAAVTVATIHSVLPERYKLVRLLRRPLQALFARLDARIAVSDAVVESVGAQVPGTRFEVIPNGVDTSFFTPDAAPLAHLVDGRRNVLFIGRFDPRNGLKHMLRAFVLLRERRDDVRLIVLGDGPLRAAYKRLVPRYLRDDVLFEGRVDQLRPRYLASADVLCTPCQLASFGMVVLEAMSSGVPVVASRISGFELLMQDGVEGLLVDPPNDDARFAAAVDHVLENPELAARMRAAGRARAVGTYSWPAVADALEQLYERLLATAKS